jgi:spermidine/putrescine transport system substrate-binding protein
MSISRRELLLASLGLIAAGCAPQSAPTVPPPTLPALPKTLTFYNWEGDMPQSVLDAFTKAFGIAVDYQFYPSHEVALAEMMAGKVFDVVTLDGHVISPAISKGLLRPLSFDNLPNFRNISSNFRDLVFDPGNKYSVPYQWGSTGLIYRTDLLPPPAPTSWLDLWRADLQGQVTGWDLMRYGMGIVLKALGYSLNTTDMDELEAARQKLQQLVPNIVSLSNDAISNAGNLSSGRAILAYGFSLDAQTARNQVVEMGQKPEAINYVLPKEGSALWSDNFVIPANSPNAYAGELFINFLLQAEISASITNNNFYATPNDKAFPLIDKAIRENSWIFPTSAQLVGSEFFLGLPEAVEARYKAIWAEFIAALPVPITN